MIVASVTAFIIDPLWKDEIGGSPILQIASSTIVSTVRITHASERCSQNCRRMFQDKAVACALVSATLCLTVLTVL